MKKNTVDIAVEKSFEREKLEYFDFDLYIGEMGLVPIFNRALRYINSKATTDLQNWNVEDVNKIIEMANEKQEVYKLILAIKTRSAKVLASFIVGLMVVMKIDFKRENVTFVIGGDLFYQPLNYEIFENEARSFLERNGCNQTQIKFERAPYANLIGIAKIIKTHTL